jgi:sortase A
VYFYEVESMEVVGPYDNSVKDQGEEAELTLITCENKGTMRRIVKCSMQEVVE